MGLLSRILSVFRVDREPSELEIARAERRRCAEAYAAAHSRGDTRREHYALARFRRATNLVLRLEREASR